MIDIVSSSNPRCVFREVALANDPWLERVSLVYYKPGVKMVMHSHALGEASVMLAGNALETDMRDQDRDLFGELRFKPQNYRHGVRFGPQGALFLAMKTRPEFENLLFDEARCKVQQFGPSPMLSRSIRHLTSLLYGTGVCTEVLKQSALEVFSGVHAEPCVSRTRNVPAWLKDARARLSETDQNISAIAKDLGLHRVYLTRAFQQYFRQSPSEYRNHCRVANGFNQVLNSDSTLAQAACETGFADQSHLTREFNRALGVTPGKLRALMNQ